MDDKKIQAQELIERDYEIVYRKGITNLVLDGLSRMN